MAQPTKAIVANITRAIEPMAADPLGIDADESKLKGDEAEEMPILPESDSDITTTAAELRGGFIGTLLPSPMGNDALAVLNMGTLLSSPLIRFDEGDDLVHDGL